MRFLVKVWGLSFMSPECAGEAWQGPEGKLATLIAWLEHAVGSTEGANASSDSVYVALPQDLYQGALPSTIVIEVLMSGGDHLHIDALRATKRRVIDRVQQFCTDNALPVPPGHVEVYFQQALVV